MGLFSFIKGAGEKIFGKSDSNNDKSQAVEKHVVDLSIPGAEVVQVTCEGDKATVSGTCETQEAKEKVLVAVGNIEGVSEIEDQLTVNSPSVESTFYEVKSGDTLSAIAKAQYGNANKYLKIFEANKPMLTHPDKIYPGQTLIIPPDEV